MHFDIEAETMLRLKCVGWRIWERTAGVMLSHGG
jgi:hypothetical protein